MTNITEQVNSFLDSDFVIRTCLLKNIVSLRALARHIISTKNLSQKNLDAAISAIRRYKRDNKQISTKESNPFKKINIKTKDNVVDMYLQKNKEIQNKIGKLHEVINYDKGEILRIIQAEEGIRLIIDEKNLERVTSLFAKQEITSIKKDLAEVILQFFPGAIKTKGIISTVSSSLNAANINIQEIMSSAPELIIILDNKDIICTLTILNNLKNL